MRIYEIYITLDTEIHQNLYESMIHIYIDLKNK